jgi:S-formylglutathione hydrolase FrmB
MFAPMASAGRHGRAPSRARVAFSVAALIAFAGWSATASPEGDSDAAAAAKGRMEYFSHASEMLGDSLNIGVYLPPDYEKGEQSYPVLYFLHGLWGTSRKWEERGTPATLDALIAAKKAPPMIVVCPDGKNSMYVNALEVESPWSDFLATELIEVIEKKYRAKKARVARAITGDSMGGYGAFNCAFRNPETFSAVSAHEAMLFPIDPDQLPEGLKRFAAQWKPVFGAPIDKENWKEGSPLAQAETLPVETLRRLAIYFDCGNRDRFGFHQTGEQLHEILKRREVPHEWFLRDGGHGRDYFSEYVGESLCFHGRLFVAAETAAGSASGSAAGSATDAAGGAP